MKILCSACLLGCPCRYDGRSTYSGPIASLAKNHTLIPVCPETMGGLPSPRDPIELTGQTPRLRDGTDCSASLEKGIAAAKQLIEHVQPDLFIAQQRSPTCGCGRIYDGSFTGRLIEGDGLLVRSVKSIGLPVIASDDPAGLKAFLSQSNEKREAVPPEKSASFVAE